MKLSDLARQIRRTIEGSFSGKTFWILADINSYTYKESNRHHYFELIEKDSVSTRIVAKIACRAWGDAANEIAKFEADSGQKFQDNIHVLVQVAVHYHTTYGLQLELITVDSSFTLGEFEKQRKATLHRLVNQNSAFIEQIGIVYITRNKQLNLSEVVQNIAVVSSVTSAGFQDFEHTLQKNQFKYFFNIDIFDAKVQGEINASAIISKLIEIFNSKKKYDVIVIIRGGGAQSDFLLFDNYELSRAVAKFPIPVITGIGHQKNETIVDLMAHTSTKTPTKAAEFLIAHNRNFEERLLRLQKVIIIETQQILRHQLEHVHGIKTFLMSNVLKLVYQEQYKITKISSILINHSKVLLVNQKKEIKDILICINTFHRLFLYQKKFELSHIQSMIRVMSPDYILKRGFAIIKIKNKVLKNSDLVIAGLEITIQLSDAEIQAMVQSKKPKHEY